MEYQLYIDGKWKNTVSGSVVPDINPADGSVYAQVHFAGEAEVGGSHRRRGPRLEILGGRARGREGADPLKGGRLDAGAHRRGRGGPDERERFRVRQSVL